MKCFQYKPHPCTQNLSCIFMFQEKKINYFRFLSFINHSCPYIRINNLHSILYTFPLVLIDRICLTMKASYASNHFLYSNDVSGRAVGARGPQPPPPHTCQLSQFSWEFPSFSSNLPVCWLEHQISWEIPTLDFSNFFFNNLVVFKASKRI